MSRDVALANIRLEDCDRWGHSEYSLDYHKDYIKQKTGLDPDTPQALKALYDLWNVDLLWYDNDGIHGEWSDYGRATDMGHAAYAADGSDERQPKICPFKTVEEVWAFDAVSEYGLPAFEDQVNEYQKAVDYARETYPNQLSTGGFYKSLVSGAIAAFGWDMLLTGAADSTKMEKVFDSFFQNTLFHMKAWAETDVEVIIQHDDFVWSSGAFMHPDIYRRVIIPRYAELWKPLKKAGKKVLFGSDGNYTEFAEDVAEAGADGFFFEPMVDFDFMVKTFGKTHCILGSYSDCRDMTFDTWDTVRKTIDKTFESLSDCRGAVVAVGNHLPANITDGMMDSYVEYLKPLLKK